MNDIAVHIGEVKLAVVGNSLSAILGSCIGILLIDRQKQLCTLSHSLLPRSPSTVEETGARWVDQAIESALALLRSQRSQFANLEAVVAGGARLLTASSHNKNSLQIGQANIDAAQLCLQAHNIKIQRMDVGGRQGRRISVSADTLTYNIELIPNQTNPS